MMRVEEEKCDDGLDTKIEGKRYAKKYYTVEVHTYKYHG